MLNGQERTRFGGFFVVLRNSIVCANINSGGYPMRTLGYIRFGVEWFLLFLSCLPMLLSFSLSGQLIRSHIKDLEGVIRNR